MLAGLAVAGVWLLEQGAVLWLARANTWLADHVIARLGYLGVFGLMFIESSFIPFPSEIIIPPAGDLARRHADWSLTAVIAMGVLGSLAGALLNYALARWLGRAALVGLIRRYGRFFRLSIEAYFRTEAFFYRHGEIGTFTGRLVPGIRQIVSLPAGLARMNLAVFSLLTSLGAGIWVVVLAYLGYRFGENAEALSATLNDASRWLAAGAVALVGGYVLWHRWRGRAGRPRRTPNG